MNTEWRTLYKGYYIRKHPWLEKHYVELDDFQLTDAFTTLEQAKDFIESNLK